MTDPSTRHAYLWPMVLLAVLASGSNAHAAATANGTVGFEVGYRRDHVDEAHGFGASVSGDRPLSERWRGTLRLSFLYATFDSKYSPLITVPLQAGVAALLGPYVWAGVELGPAVWSAAKLDMGQRSMSLGLSVEPTLGVRFSSVEIRWGGNLLYSPSALAFASMFALGWRFSTQ